jgi:hypothetical protein
VRNGEVEAYADAIENHLTTLRGAPVRLPPRDFALARTFCEGGVALAAVLSALDTLAEREAPPTLAACRGLLERLPSGYEGTRPRSVPDAAAVGVTHPEVQERLRQLQESLEERDAPAPVRRRVEELRELLSVATRPNSDHLRLKLAEIDAQVRDLALGWLEPGQRDAWTREAQGAFDRQRGRVSEEALEASLVRHLESRAREALGLPRVAIL